MIPTPHVRVSYPADLEKGQIRSPRLARYFITMPGQEEVPLESMISAELRVDINEPERVHIEFYGTIEITYDDDGDDK